MFNIGTMRMYDILSDITFNSFSASWKNQKCINSMQYYSDHLDKYFKYAFIYIKLTQWYL